MEILEEQITRMENSAGSAVYACFLKLLAQSRQTDALYSYFGRFVQMLESENAYVRTRGLLFIAANARWDTEYKVDEVIDEYLAHIMDIKPTVSRQMIAALPELAAAKPELAPDIRRALQNANPGRYKDSMAPLVQKDIAKALGEIQI